MNPFDSIIRANWCPQIKDVLKTDATTGIAKWLYDKQLFSIIIADTNADQFGLSFAYIQDAIASLGWDYNRLYSAVVETGRRIEQDNLRKDEIAWLLIKLYYSAFYSAHAIMRVCGRGIIHVDDKLYQAFKKSSVSSGISSGSYPSSSGLYSLKIDIVSNKIILKRVADSGKSHVALWSAFTDFLETLDKTALSSDAAPEKAQILSNYLTSLKKVMGQKADHGWLSYFRNEVTYKHEFGTWYPNSGINGTASTFILQNRKRLISDLVNFPSEMDGLEYKDDLMKFYVSCKFILCMCISTGHDLELRSTEQSKSIYGINGRKLYKTTTIRPASI